MINRIFLFLILGAAAVMAATTGAEVVTKEASAPTIVMFVVFVIATLGVTYWAAKRTRSAKDFYTAGGGITGFQNGLAIAGDYMSAASFLGIAALVYANGYDGLIYSIGFLIGWPIVLFLIAEPLRNLGQYTFTDIASYRLSQSKIRTLAAFGSIVTVILYLIAQMVGGGKLIESLFYMDYKYAVALVGFLMILYVLFGGMLATTWVQIIKAFLLLSGASFMAIAVMAHYNFSFETLFSAAIEVHDKGASIMAPGQLITDPVSAISLGLALIFGVAGLPHILMRFFTVSNAKEARKSVLYATGFIGYFYMLVFIIGFGAIVLVFKNPEYIDVAKATLENPNVLIGGNTMSAVHLAHAVGGEFFLGFISAVAFATIIAVVAGLTLAGASAISHDLYVQVYKKGKVDANQEMKISRIVTIVLGFVAVFLGLAFENQNIAFLVGLAFAIAASVNFPILFLSIYWRGLTTRGAIAGGTIGLITAVILVVISPTVWVEIFGFAEALFPYKYPALFSIPAAFIGTYIFSVTDKSESAKAEKAKFDAQYIRAQTGIGAEGAISH